MYLFSLTLAYVTLSSSDKSEEGERPLEGATKGTHIYGLRSMRHLPCPYGQCYHGCLGPQLLGLILLIPPPIMLRKMGFFSYYIELKDPHNGSPCATAPLSFANGGILKKKNKKWDYCPSLSTRKGYPCPYHPPIYIYIWGDRGWALATHAHPISPVCCGIIP